MNHSTPTQPWLCVGALVALCAALANASSAVAQDLSDDITRLPQQAKPSPQSVAELPAGGATGELSSQRWHDHAFGLSFFQPAGVPPIEQPHNGGLVHFQVEPQFTISFFIHKSPDRFTLDQAKTNVLRQFAFQHAQALPMKEGAISSLKQLGRPTWQYYYFVPQGDDATIKQARPTATRKSDWVFAQSLIIIDPHTIAELRLACDQPDLERAEALYEAMLASIILEDPAVLERERRAALEAGDTWRRQLSAEAIRSAAPAKTVMRITRGGHDVGLLRVTQGQHEAASLPGWQVKAETALSDQRYFAITNASYFASDDGMLEFWSINTARRDNEGMGVSDQLAEQTANRAKVKQWLEEGVRTSSEITVNNESPSDLFGKKQWRTPERFYMSQVDMWTLGPLLPEGPATLAFYAYDPTTQSIALRTYRVEPSEQGMKIVRVRSSPTRAEEVYLYDAAGRLVRHITPDGSVLSPISEDQAKQLFKKPQ